MLKGILVNGVYVVMMVGLMVVVLCCLVCSVYGFHGGALTLSMSNRNVCVDQCDMLYSLSDDNKCLGLFQGNRIDMVDYIMCVREYERLWMICMSYCR